MEKERHLPTLHLKEIDPLCGILSEDQVGIDPATGRLRVDPDVLHGMRQYLFGSEGADMKIKEDRIKSSMASLANDPLPQKSTLHLEPTPLISYDVDKGKGLVYDFQIRENVPKRDKEKVEAQKLMASTINSGNAMKRVPATTKTMSEGEIDLGYQDGSAFYPCPTTYRPGFSEASSSRTGK